MKRLLLVLTLAVLLALTIFVIHRQLGPGYILLSFSDISIEASFVFGLTLLVFGFLVFYYALRTLTFLLRFPLYYRLRARHRRSEQAKHSLMHGLMDLMQGRFVDAEKSLLKNITLCDTSVLNYLVAARAAHQQAAYQRRDEYIRLAKSASADATLAADITLAELQMSHHQYELAQQNLLHADGIVPKQAYIKTLLAKTYEQLGDWASLSNLLEDLRKNRLLNEAQYSELEIFTYQGLLRQLSRQANAQEVLALWQRLPKHLKDNSSILQIYAEQLVIQHQTAEAENLIRIHLQKNWHEPLVEIFGELASSKPQTLLETAESWLPAHRQSAVLLLVLGKLCLKNKLWGKARTYLEASLNLKPMTDTYLNLAMLLEDKMQEPVKAQQLYQQGLKLAVQCGVGNDTPTPPTKLAAVPLRVV